MSPNLYKPSRALDGEEAECKDDGTEVEVKSVWYNLDSAYQQCIMDI